MDSIFFTLLKSTMPLGPTVSLALDPFSTCHELNFSFDPSLSFFVLFLFVIWQPRKDLNPDDMA